MNSSFVGSTTTSLAAASDNADTLYVPAPLPLVSVLCVGHGVGLVHGAHAYSRLRAKAAIIVELYLSAHRN